jgi:hypothetical protein
MRHNPECLELTAKAPPGSCLEATGKAARPSYFRAPARPRCSAALGEHRAVDRELRPQIWDVLRPFADAKPVNAAGTRDAVAGAGAAAEAAVAAMGGAAALGERSAADRALRVQMSKPLRPFADAKPVNAAGTPDAVASAGAAAEAAVAAMGGLERAERRDRDPSADFGDRDTDGPLNDLVVCATCGFGKLGAPMAALGVAYASSVAGASFLLVNFPYPRELVTAKVEDAVSAQLPIVAACDMREALLHRNAPRAVREIIAAGAALTADISDSCVCTAGAQQPRPPTNCLLCLLAAVSYRYLSHGERVEVLSSGTGRGDGYQGRMALTEMDKVVQRAHSAGLRIYIGLSGTGDAGTAERDADKKRVGSRDQIDDWTEEHYWDIGPDWYWARAAEVLAISSAKEVFGEEGMWKLGNGVLNRLAGGGGGIPFSAARTAGAIFVLVA